jgi:hypothetical protein
MRSRKLRAVVALGCVALGLLVFPRWLCGRDAAAYFDGDLATQDALARSVANAVIASPDLQIYRTGADRFDGQASIAVYQMTLLGLGQIVREHPEQRDAYLPAMRVAAERLADPRTHPYAKRVYGQHGVVGMAPGQGHAYLGYINLGLGMLRAVDPKHPLAALHDRITDELARRLAESPTGLIETYPGETWPPDVAAVAGSIGLHAAVTGHPRTELLETWARRFEVCAVHHTGYLIQRVRSGTCEPADGPRGSGTAVASYFLSFASPELSRRLYQALVEQGRVSFVGFGGFLEHLPGEGGAWDVNAGPELFGVSTGATGFGLGAARAQRDRGLFVELYRTGAFVGIPVGGAQGTRFAVGGVLGNALILAMLTAGAP